MSFHLSASTIRGTLLLFLTFLSLKVARGQEIGEAGIKDRDAAVNFCRQLQSAVKAGEKSKVAAWINDYPIEIQHEAKSFLVADDTDFIDKFDLVFDADTRNAVSAADACDVPLYPSGTVKIARGEIEILQTEEGARTLIATISPPADFQSLYENNDVYEAGAAEFLRRLRQVVSANDRRLISDLCRYPLSVNVGGKHRDIRNRAALIAEYSSIFTPEVKKAVLALPAPIHMGWRGFMTDRGELWFDLVVGTHVFRIGTINGGYLPAKTKPKGH